MFSTSFFTSKKEQNERDLRYRQIGSGSKSSQSSLIEGSTIGLGNSHERNIFPQSSRIYLGNRFLDSFNIESQKIRKGKATTETGFLDRAFENAIAIDVEDNDLEPRPNDSL